MIVDWQEIEWHIAIVTTGKRREILGKRAIQLQLLAIGSGSAHLLHSAGNCAVGAYTHNIALSADRAKETKQTSKMMFELGYVRPEEVPQIPRLAKGPKAILYSPLGDAPMTPDVVLFLQTCGSAVVLGSGEPSGCRDWRARTGQADVHGAPSGVRTRDDHEPWMHRESCVHGLR